MDLSLARIIKSRTNSAELENSYRKVLIKIMQILEDLLSLRDENVDKIADVLCLYQGNVWNIIQKFQTELESAEGSLHDNSIDSWRRSDTSNDDKLISSEMKVHLNLPKSEHKAGNFLRSGTYRERKKSMLKSMFSNVNPKNHERNISNTDKNMIIAERSQNDSPRSEAAIGAISNVKDMIKNLVVKRIVADDNKILANSIPAILEDVESVDSDTQIYTDIIRLDSIKFEITAEPTTSEIYRRREILKLFKGGESDERDNVSRFFVKHCLSLAKNYQNLKPQKSVKIEIGNLDDPKVKPTVEVKHEGDT